MTLAGCSLAPSFERPELPIVSRWAPVKKVGSGETARPELHNALIADWRSFLPDPHLQALIEAAFDHNRDMRIAVARVEEARALYGITRADRLPTVNLGASQTAARTPGQLTLTGQPQTNRRYDVNIGFTAFELDFWGRVRNLTDAALASYFATDEARESFRLSLIADVANAYFTVQELEERSMVAHATVDSRAESLRLLTKRREVGLAGDLDFLAADAAYESARAEVADLERSRAVAANALNLLVGTMPQNLPPRRSLVEQGNLPDIPVAVPSEVLLHRPDVRAAEQRLIAANANIGAARAAFLPRIGLSLVLGTASQTLTGLFDSGTGAWSFAPNLVQPLFDSGRTKASVSLAEARKVIAVADYEKTIQEAFREVADELVARDQLAEQLNALSATEKSQSERLKLVDARYRAGVSNYLELLDAQRDAFTAQQNTLQVRRALLTSTAKLYKVLGGSSSKENEENPS